MGRTVLSALPERPVLKGEVTTEHPNQAVPGLVYRLFTRSPSFVVYPDNVPTPAEFHNLADVGRPLAVRTGRQFLSRPMPKAHGQRGPSGPAERK